MGSFSNPPTDQDIASRNERQSSSFRTFAVLALVAIGMAFGYLVWSDIQMRTEYREIRQQAEQIGTLFQNSNTAISAPVGSTYVCTVLTGSLAGGQYQYTQAATSKRDAVQRCDAASSGVCDCQAQ